MRVRVRVGVIVRVRSRERVRVMVRARVRVRLPAEVGGAGLYADQHPVSRRGKARSRHLAQGGIRPLNHLTPDRERPRPCRDGRGLGARVSQRSRRRTTRLLSAAATAAPVARGIHGIHRERLSPEGFRGSIERGCRMRASSARSFDIESEIQALAPPTAGRRAGARTAPRLTGGADAQTSRILSQRLCLSGASGGTT